MIRLVFMLEEPSAERFLRSLMPKVLADAGVPEHKIDCIYIPHSGKSDLQQSIPTKLRGWHAPDSVFVILHDQDSSDCKNLKRDLQALCARQNRHTPLIRIVCKELEAWYFGDLEAVEKAFPNRNFKARKYQNIRKYRVPDAISNPDKEIMKIAGVRKNEAAAKIPERMDIHRNKSVSFRHFVTGVQKLVRENLQAV